MTSETSFGVSCEELGILGSFSRIELSLFPFVFIVFWHSKPLALLLVATLPHALGLGFAALLS